MRSINKRLRWIVSDLGGQKVWHALSNIQVQIKKCAITHSKSLLTIRGSISFVVLR